LFCDFGEGSESQDNLALSDLTFLIYLKEVKPCYRAAYISVQECMYTKLCIAHGLLLSENAFFDLVEISVFLLSLSIQGVPVALWDCSILITRYKVI
jgi:hypothetical protein